MSRELSASAPLGSIPCVVIKVGSSTIVDETQTVRVARMAALVESVHELRKQGYRVVIVSSGAVALGCLRMGRKERPTTVNAKQATAAVGQGHLIRTWDHLFTTVGITIGQVLLTHADLGERQRYKNALNTFRELFALDVVPIVNENDTVAIRELRFGDNDSLSALVANLVMADWLLLLTDVDCLYTSDPRKNPDARPLLEITDFSSVEFSATSEGASGIGTGGMATKITAAKLAHASGIRTVILHGKEAARLPDVVQGTYVVGTHVVPSAAKPAKVTKRWLQGVKSAGYITLDKGACKAVANGNSLFAAGIVRVEGTFDVDDVVVLRGEDDVEIARGLMNYSSVELQQLQGKRSKDVASILGYEGPSEVIHRDHLLRTKHRHSPTGTSDDSDLGGAVHS